MNYCKELEMAVEHLEASEGAMSPSDYDEAWYLVQTIEESKEDKETMAVDLMEFISNSTVGKDIDGRLYSAFLALKDVDVDVREQIQEYLDEANFNWLGFRVTQENPFLTRTLESLEHAESLIG